MGLKLIYKNHIGEITMHGNGFGNIRVCKIEGLGPLIYEYTSSLYSGYDGQETLSKRAEARAITMMLEVLTQDDGKTLKSALRVFQESGTLYINTRDFERRIMCSQVKVTDVRRVLKRQIATFVVQFVCDSPYFEDGEDTVYSLYKRTKNLKSPFTLPCEFGSVTAGGSIEILGIVRAEPVITLYYPESLAGAEHITILNETSGSFIKLDYLPEADETIEIDIKRRKITSDKNGNIINHLSSDTFLGNFALNPGVNILSVDMGDVTPTFTIECRYNNLYSEAVLI